MLYFLNPEKNLYIIDHQKKMMRVVKQKLTTYIFTVQRDNTFKHDRLFKRRKTYKLITIINMTTIINMSTIKM